MGPARWRARRRATGPVIVDPIVVGPALDLVAACTVGSVAAGPGPGGGPAGVLGGGDKVVVAACTAAVGPTGPSAASRSGGGGPGCGGPGDAT